MVNDTVLSEYKGKFSNKIFNIEHLGLGIENWKKEEITKE
jgi:hypothetical protein